MGTNAKKQALRFIVLMGLVSLFADFTYEGARSIRGSFLAVLGASGAAVGAVVGLGELIGYGVRILSGMAADRMRAYWLFTILGYLINLVAVPLLALAGSWHIAAALIILERLGKGLRTPARDAMLSFATKQVGQGFGFGLHEALDQIGALAGPLMVAGVLFYRHEYNPAFAFLAIPALVSFAILIAGRISFPRPERMEIGEKRWETKRFPKIFWIYVLASSFVGAGFIDFAILSYHFEKNEILARTWIPLFYAFAMSTDGISALVMGKIFDLKGISTLAAVTAAASFFAPLVLFGGFATILIGVLLWGISLGAQESIMRSYIAVIIPPGRRATAYGILYLSFGLFWFLGSTAIGILYDISLLGAVIFSMAAQLCGAVLFLFCNVQRHR